jgi:hypothetical protein
MTISAIRPIPVIHSTVAHHPEDEPINLVLMILTDLWFSGSGAIANDIDFYPSRDFDTGR